MFGLKKRIIRDVIKDVIEDSLKQRIPYDKFVDIKHSAIQPNEDSSRYVSQRQCLCGLTKKTPSGEEYTLIDFSYDKGKYFLTYAPIIFKGQEYRVWYGICDICLTIYWESFDKSTNMVLVKKTDYKKENKIEDIE